jgi:hypothetical protein
MFWTPRWTNVHSIDRHSYSAIWIYASSERLHSNSPQLRKGTGSILEDYACLRIDAGVGNFRSSAEAEVGQLTWPCRSVGWGLDRYDPPLP